MTTESNGSPHVEWQALLDGIESPVGLPPAMRDHLTTCGACQALHDSARALLATLGRARLPALPDELVERTLAHLGRLAADETATGEATGHGAAPAPLASAASPRSTGRFEQLVAELRAQLEELAVRCVGDSLTASPALRGAPATGPRSRLYETESHAITVSLERPDPGAAGTLRGQLIPRSGETLPAGCRAYLGSSSGLVECGLDPLGGFAFDRVPGPPLDLVVVVGSRFAPIGALADLEPRVPLDPP